MKYSIIIISLCCLVLLPDQFNDNISIALFFCPNCTELFILNATTLDCALYDFHPELIISNATKRIVVDWDNKPDVSYVRAKRKSGYMHNKFCIVDSLYVITGSANPTQNGLTRNKNNIFIIESQQVVHTFQQKFDQLWYDTKQSHTFSFIHPVLAIYFCPEDFCEKQIMNQLQNAKESIYFMQFSFTSQPIATVLIEQKYEGLDVQGLVHRVQPRGEVTTTLQNHLPVTRYSHGTLHHKVFIIDEKTVIAGSYNPSINANTRNDETILIIHDREIAKAFMNEYNFLLNE